MLKKENRLRKEKDFKAVLGRGRYVVTPLFLLKYTPNGLSHHRYGFVVSTKVSKKAPVRNTIKRRMRAIVKKQGKKAEKGYDMAFLVKKEIVGASFQDIKEIMEVSMQKISQFSSRT